MRNIEKNLEVLGMNNDEILIYLSCLEYGDLSMSSISRLSKIPRVNCYYHTEKLLEKGYISVYQKNKVKIFSAENPKILVNKQKEKLNIAQNILPELLMMIPKGAKKPKIKFFEGTSGIKNIYEKILEKGENEIVSFSNFDKLGEFFEDDNFLIEHFDSRQKKEIKTRFISPGSESVKNIKKKIFPAEYKNNLLEIFLLSSKEFFFESEITIFSGSIAIINLDNKSPVGVLIENEGLYKTQKAIFDLAWLGATSFITN